jgi:hypothetical protein
MISAVYYPHGIIMNALLHGSESYLPLLGSGEQFIEVRGSLGIVFF